MRIYYFNGGKAKGVDLTNELEDISINMQKKKALRQVGVKIHMFKDTSLQECIDYANKYGGYTGTMVQPNQKAIEGEHEDRLYYLHKYVIKWCKNRSLKALLIRLVGVDIENGKNVTSDKCKNCPCLIYPYKYTVDNCNRKLPEEDWFATCSNNMAPTGHGIYGSCRPEVCEGPEGRRYSVDYKDGKVYYHD